MNIQKGFTIIELLVVIAIIGILSSIVMVMVNDARTKGADSGIKSTLTQVRNRMELIRDANNSYSGGCADTTIVAQLLAAQKYADITGPLNTSLATGGSNTTVTCHIDTTTNSWAVEVPLKSSASNAWCVDATGASQKITTHLAIGDTTCN